MSFSQDSIRYHSYFGFFMKECVQKLILLLLNVLLKIMSFPVSNKIFKIVRISLSPAKMVKKLMSCFPCIMMVLP